MTIEAGGAEVPGFSSEAMVALAILFFITPLVAVMILRAKQNGWFNRPRRRRRRKD